ncbi:U-box domain-containing protein 35-like [Castanea sativa]|uniref:U-box domain-containing protein 35-like n=1 Tax=Castanea sativa TaxID=21020 RepID=UPI003F651F9B
MSVSLSSEIGHVQSHDEASASTTVGYRNQYNAYSSVSEIEEESSSTSEIIEVNDHGLARMETIKEESFGASSLYSLDLQSLEDSVYVAVGKSESSMEALVWTLKNAVTSPSTMVYLVHVFPEILYIPSPLGKIPKNQVNPEQVQSYMDQERNKRRELLQKFINACSSSKVKVDTILIESEMVSKAILDLIPIVNIRKLVLGTTKSSLRRSKSRKGNGIADQVLQSAPVSCEVKIICEGKEVIDPTSESPTRSPRARGNDENNPKPTQSSPVQRSSSKKFQRTDSFKWLLCFRPKE